MTADLIARLRDLKGRVKHAEAEEALEEAARAIEGMQAAAAEQLAALELAWPILEQHEPCGYYCDEDHGHIDHPATHAVYRAINEFPLGATLLEEVRELRAWQEKVCALIQPAETPDEWGADVADIIKSREEQRKAALAVVEAARHIHNRNMTGFRVSTGIIDALAAFALAARAAAGGEG